jgi:hypothetical protein
MELLMPNRRLAILLLLATLVVAFAPSSTVKGDVTPFQELDRRACYAKCPCYSPGFQQACADCRQKCEREFWKDFDVNTRRLEKE